MTLAFLGTGLMGAGFVRRQLAQGQAVNVWNRSPAKAQALQAHGAKAFASAAEAVAGAQRIHLSLADDASVDAVLEPLAGVIPKQVWIVDHTTTAVRATAERVARWRARGHTFVHAPVFMGPANCVEGTGLMLASGPKADFDALLPVLQTMTGKVVHLGEGVERAAAFKLFGNLTLIGMMGVLGDVGRLANAVGMSPQEAYSLFEHFNPGATLPARAARICNGTYLPPNFEMTMARKDVRLMIEEAKAGGIELAAMPVMAALMDAGIARGEGGWDAAACARWPV